MKNIIVVFGGKSVEHDISIITGVLTCNALSKEKYNAVPIYVSKDGSWLYGEELLNIDNFKNKKFKKVKNVTFVLGSNFLYEVNGKKLNKLFAISSAINCMHGVNGEDGTLFGVMKLCNIPFSSPQLFGSSFAIDKDFTKIFLSGINVEKLPYVRVFKSTYYERKENAVKIIEKKFTYPVIVKPSCLGSSIGIVTAKNKEELITAFDKAFIYDDKVIVEKELVGFKEINCAAYRKGDKIILSECEEPFTKNEILTFKDKYEGYKTGYDRKIPANISKTLRDKILSITEKIYRKADFVGVIRIDYLIYEDKVYVNEINTVPGSLAYYLFTDSIKGFSELLDDLISEGIKKWISQDNKTYEYASNVLSNVAGKGGKIKSLTKNKNKWYNLFPR